MIPVVYIFITSLFHSTVEHHGHDNMIIRYIKYYLRKMFVLKDSRLSIVGMYPPPIVPLPKHIGQSRPLLGKYRPRGTG
jgi:hypothetical protein